MKKSTGSKKISRHLIVLMLTVSLVAGAAVLGNDAFAVTSTSSPFRNTKSSYQHHTRFDGNLIVHGVDVSYFQSVATEWDKAKKNGCDYAIMRVTYSTYGNGSLNIDSKFATHFNKARAAGVMKGVYIFSQATSVKEARAEAQYGINRLKALGIGPEDLELPLYMDYEFAGSTRGRNKGRLYGISSSTAIKCVNAFADVVRANGYDPGVYACTSFFNKYLGNGRDFASDIDMWCAQYYNRNESPCNYTKWQYTSTARVDGVRYYATNKEGAVDADFWYLNRKANKSAITTIYGNTNVAYTGKAVLPTLQIYAGSTLLKEGTDYIIGGINNVNKSKSGAYAFVKGIGKYSGYALVPITIDSGFIAHKGLSGVGGAIFTNKNGGSCNIGSGSGGAYVRKVPAGSTAKTLLSKLALKSKYKSKYTLAVINAYGAKVTGDTRVTTGMMIGVYSGSKLVGTADITVNGETINDKGANYMSKANRSSVTYNTNTPLAKVAPPGTTEDGKLIVDGEGGSATIKKLQSFLGVKQTGTVTIKKKLRKYSSSVTAVKSGKKDKNTVKPLQKWLGVKADGVWGRKTSKALQKKLGVSSDGYFGKKSMKALQRFLNTK